MTDASLFRWLLLGGFVAAGVIGVYHRWRAHSGEPLARREEGLFILISIRGVAAIGAIGLLIYLINPDWMAWSTMPLPLWARWCGVALGILNIPFLWWVFHTLGTNITDTVVTRIKHALVVVGPYRWVRHPFYVAGLPGVIATSLITANWFFALVGGVVFALLAWRSRTEEDKLIDRFGDDYREYRRRTGRFVPRLFGRG